ncbi:vWA domain-containing protein [Paludisphaera borealis]|uniref:von Willebrand factor related domain n=1 Tax=Paludisphaera borealis TaxID=1387353 RepID=A0A1U7CJA1_9BACT|nr:VWA domain-containing protein [Paludisphaera borealis]APW59011.1 von Willebrand factor related domain [Paludisphaera borealis]
MSRIVCNTGRRDPAFSPCGRRVLQPGLSASALLLFLALSSTLEAEEAPPPPEAGNTVVVTGASQQEFPRIAVQFELRRPDGTFLRDARKDEFRVAEDGKELPILEFQAPLTTESVATTIVLVVDRSLSMQEEDRMGSLKEAVATFLEKTPEGSRVAVVAFGSEVDLICPFTTDRDRVRAAVDRLHPGGATRFYDAVAEALAMLDHEHGRRAVLALTDGHDTSSQEANLPADIAAARRLGLPVYTLGLGTEEAIAGDALKALAESTRGQYYPAQRAEELKAVYTTIAERLGASYSLVYQSDRRLPDGTLRPVQVFHQSSRKAGETAVFIPGMVVPASGWSPLFLALTACLGLLMFLPSLLRRRPAQA